MSNLLNSLASFSWASVTSILGIGYTSLMTLSFNGLRLTQIWVDPDGLGTTTMAAHHGVGPVTQEITPRFFILCNSWLTFSCNEIGTCLGVKREKG